MYEVKYMVNVAVTAGAQCFIMQIFNFYILKAHLTKQSYPILIVLAPVLSILSGLIANQSPIFSGLFLTAVLVGLNQVITKSNVIDSLFPISFLLCSLIMYLLISDIFSLSKVSAHLGDFIRLGAFVVGGFIAVYLQSYLTNNLLDFFNKRKIVKLLCKWYIVILAILMFTTVQGKVVVESNVNSLILEALFVALLLIAVLSMIFSFLNELHRTKLKNELQQIKQLENYAAVLEDGYRNLRKIKHDYVNVISSSLFLLEDQEYADLRKYYKETLTMLNADDKYDEIRIGDLQNIGNSALKGIIAYKLIQAEHQKLKIHFECIQPIGELQVANVHIVEIVGILMDNAIEYVETNGGQIDVVVTVNEGYRSILIRNSLKKASKTNLREIFQEGYTTKGNHEGIGLSSLRDITAKEDHLEVMTSIENGYFLQEIVC